MAQKRNDVVVLKLGLIHRQVAAQLLNLTLEAHAGPNRALTVKINRGLKLLKLTLEMEALNDQTQARVIASNVIVMERALGKAFDEGKRDALVKAMTAIVQVRAGWVEMAQASEELTDYDLDWAAAKVLLDWLTKRKHWAWHDEKRENPAPLHYVQTEAIWHLEEQLKTALGIQREPDEEKQEG